MSLDIPMILRRNKEAIRLTKDPLKPVCPVIKTFLFLKVFLKFIILINFLFR